MYMVVWVMRSDSFLSSQLKGTGSFSQIRQEAGPVWWRREPVFTDQLCGCGQDPRPSWVLLPTLQNGNEKGLSLGVVVRVK